MCCRQIKGNCAESFTEYWTCLDYSNIAELRHCRAEQKTFDGCVLDKLGWQRPDLGELSKVSQSGSTREGTEVSVIGWVEDSGCSVIRGMSYRVGCEDK